MAKMNQMESPKNRSYWLSFPPSLPLPWILTPLVVYGTRPSLVGLGGRGEVICFTTVSSVRGVVIQRKSEIYFFLPALTLCVNL